MFIQFISMIFILKYINFHTILKIFLSISTILYPIKTIIVLRQKGKKWSKQNLNYLEEKILLTDFFILLPSLLLNVNSSLSIEAFIVKNNPLLYTFHFFFKKFSDDEFTFFFPFFFNFQTIKMITNKLFTLLFFLHYNLFELFYRVYIFMIDKESKKISISPKFFLCSLSFFDAFSFPLAVYFHHMNETETSIFQLKKRRICYSWHSSFFFWHVIQINFHQLREWLFEGCEFRHLTVNNCK